MRNPSRKTFPRKRDKQVRVRKAYAMLFWPTRLPSTPYHWRFRPRRMPCASWHPAELDKEQDMGHLGLSSPDRVDPQPLPRPFAGGHQGPPKSLVEIKGCLMVTAARHHLVAIRRTVDRARGRGKRWRERKYGVSDRSISAGTLCKWVKGLVEQYPLVRAK